MDSRLKTMLVLFVSLFSFGLMAGCGSFMAVKKGTCNPGRTWVDPVKKDGKWVDGHCRNN